MRSPETPAARNQLLGSAGLFMALLLPWLGNCAAKPGLAVAPAERAGQATMVRVRKPVEPQNRPRQLALSFWRRAATGDCRALFELAPPGVARPEFSPGVLAACRQRLGRELTGAGPTASVQRMVEIDANHRLVQFSSGAALLLVREGGRWYVEDLLAERDLGGGK